MKPSNIRPIIAENFAPEDRDMIARLGGVLNYFMRQMIEILSENVDFDNLAWELATVNVLVDANGSPIQLTQFRSSINNPQGVIVVKAQNTSNIGTYPTAQPFISYTPTGGGVIRVDNVSGLQVDNKYTLSIIVF